LIDQEYATWTALEVCPDPHAYKDLPRFIEKACGIVRGLDADAQAAVTVTRVLTADERPAVIVVWQLQMAAGCLVLVFCCMMTPRARHHYAALQEHLQELRLEEAEVVMRIRRLGEQVVMRIDLSMEVVRTTVGGLVQLAVRRGPLRRSTSLPLSFRVALLPAVGAPPAGPVDEAFDTDDELLWGTPGVTNPLHAAEVGMNSSDPLPEVHFENEVQGAPTPTRDRAEVSDSPPESAEKAPEMTTVRIDLPDGSARSVHDWADVLADKLEELRTESNPDTRFTLNVEGVLRTNETTKKTGLPGGWQIYCLQCSTRGHSAQGCETPVFQRPRNWVTNAYVRGKDNKPLRATITVPASDVLLAHVEDRMKEVTGSFSLG